LRWARDSSPAIDLAQLVELGWSYHDIISTPFEFTQLCLISYNRLNVLKNPVPEPKDLAKTSTDDILAYERYLREKEKLNG
jgi:hypothetical protein